MRLNRLWAGSSVALSAFSAQFCAFSLNESDCFDFVSSSRCQGDRLEASQFNEFQNEGFVMQGSD
jgi:hypothetical protein